jgi:hypothetical protein
MKTGVKVLLWTGWLLGPYLAFLLLGSVLYAPVADLPYQVVVAQLGGLFGGPLGLTVCGVVLVLVSIVSRRLLRRLRQRESDALGLRILEDLRNGRPPAREFYLYLRAFETTGRLRAPLFSFDLATLGLGRLRTNELESFIGAAMVKSGPLIALGRPGENLGAGRVITSDDDWRSDIVLLTAQAKAILLIPSHHAGTLWEIQHLEEQGLLAKTVFVMPPESRSFNWRAHWSLARPAMGPLGASLPEYQDLGMLFMLEPSGAVRGVAPFSLFVERSFRNSVRKLLAETAPSPDLPRALTRAVRGARRWRFFGRMDFTLRSAALLGFAYALFAAGHLPRAARPAPGWAAFADRWLAATELEYGKSRLWSDIESTPAYRARAHGMSAAQVGQFRSQLLEDGFRRLDDAQVRALFLFLNELMDRSDPAACAAIARGSLAGEALDMARAAVDPAVIRAWFDVQREAALRALQQAPLHAVSSQARNAAESRFEASLTPAETRRLRAVTADGHANSLDDDCWLRRRTYAAVRTMPAPDNLAWARVLLGAVAEATPLEELQQSPLYLARIRGLSEQKAEAVTNDLMIKGIARLDDASLLTRAAVLAEMLAAADEATCGAIALGAAKPGQFDAALERLAAPRQAAFQDSLYRAALAELKQTPAPQVSQAQLKAAEDRFAATSFTEADLPRLERINKAPGAPPAPDACWMARKKYAAVGGFEEPYNRVLARALALGLY